MRDELMRVVQKQFQTQNLGCKRIKETKACMLPTGGEVGIP